MAEVIDIAKAKELPVLSDEQVTRHTMNLFNNLFSPEIGELTNGTIEINVEAEGPARCELGEHGRSAIHLPFEFRDIWPVQGESKERVAKALRRRCTFVHEMGHAVCNFLWPERLWLVEEAESEAAALIPILFMWQMSPGALWSLPPANPGHWAVAQQIYGVYGRSRGVLGCMGIAYGAKED